MRVLCVVPLVLLSAPAVAQEAPLAKIYACSDVADGVQRLACFDAAVAGLKQAETSGGVAVVSRAQIEKAQKEAFGLATPSITALAESAAASAPVKPTSAATPVEKPKPLDNVVLAVKQIEKGADGKMRFIMENGQIWRQTDTMQLSGLGKGPWEVEVRKAALGGFMMKVDGRTAIRVKRVE
jgi:hypothetical protein